MFHFYHHVYSTCIIDVHLYFAMSNSYLLSKFFVKIAHTYFCPFPLGSEDGRLSCGYSSFRGKRATMEDFYDIKTSKVDGQTVSLFGIFDG